MPPPADPRFAERVRDSFSRQKAMALIGARLTAVQPGRVEVELPFRDDLTQQKGFARRARQRGPGRPHAYRGARRGVLS